MNLGVLTHDGELVIPPFERSLAGCTVRRLLDLVEEVTPGGHWPERVLCFSIACICVRGLCCRGVMRTPYTYTIFRMNAL